MSLQNGNDLEDNNMKRSLTKESVSQKVERMSDLYIETLKKKVIQKIMKEIRNLDKIESINEQTQQDLFEKLNRVRTLSTINYFTLNHVPGLPGYGSQLHPIIQKMENEKEDPVYIPPPKQLKLNITEKKLDLEEERSFKEDFSEHPPTFNLIRSQFLPKSRGRPKKGSFPTRRQYEADLTLFTKHRVEKVAKMIRIGNTSEKLEGHEESTHKWRAFVSDEENSDLSNLIRCVWFKLHSSFHERLKKRYIKCEQHPFAIELDGWGEFDIEITVEFHHQQLANLFHIHGICIFARNNKNVIEKESDIRLMIYKDSEINPSEIKKIEDQNDEDTISEEETKNAENLRLFDESDK